VSGWQVVMHTYLSDLWHLLHAAMGIYQTSQQYLPCNRGAATK